MKSVLHIGASAVFLVTSVANPLLWAAPAFANPENGQVVAGAATISETGAKLDVVQHSDRAVIDWQAFDIGAGEHTEFHQPSAAATALNRVTGASLSDISGRLSANGTVILVNRNGVVFRVGAEVDVGALVATTADIANDRFMAGDMRFDSPGDADARISNAGTITARDAGLVGLVAPQVENSGVISAKLGTVHLASGDTFSLDLSGRNLVGIAVSDTVKSQLVRSTGRIEAEGGRVVISAAAGRELVNSLIHIEGEITAPSIAAHAGSILISDEAVLPRAPALPTRKIFVAATVDASGDAPGERGGDITIEGDDISLASAALLRAAGYNVSTGSAPVGGSIRVGGDYQGAPSDINNARFVTVDPGARLIASASHTGNGGRIILWADGIMDYAGYAESRGGAFGGDGGFIEISGKRLLRFSGDADTSAALGSYGELLLDPGDITVCQFGASSVGACNPSGTPSLVAAANIFDSGANATSYVDIGATGTTGTLLNLLNGANVTIRTNAGGAGSGDITIADPVSWASTRLLTLDAHRDIVVNAAMTGNQMTFNPGRDLVLNANLTDSGTSTLIIAPRTGGAASMSIGSAAGILNLQTAEFARILTGWNTFNFGSTAYTGSIALDGLTAINPLTVLTGNGSVTTSGVVAMAAHALSISTRNLAIGGSITGSGALSLQPDGNVTVGIGSGATGTFNLDDTELNNLGTTFSGITIGRATSTGDIDVRARTWNDPLTIRTGNATININGIQTMGANALSLSSRMLNIGANITGSGALVLAPDANATVGIGDGAAGTFNLDSTELSRLGTTFSGITIGLNASDANMDVRASTWNDPLTLQVRNGIISVNGAVAMGGNALNLISRGIIIAGAITGTGTLTLQPDGNVTVGIGDGSVGAYQLLNAELDLLGSTFSSVSLGRTNSSQAMDIRAYSNWRDNITFQTGTGTITVNGAQNFGGNNATFTSRGLVFAQPVSNGGILSISPDGNVAMGVGTGQPGTLVLSDTTLNNIQGTWGTLVFGNAGGLDSILTVGARNWNYNTEFIVDDNNLVIAGAQTMAAGRNLALRSDRDIIVNAALNGSATSTLTFNSSNAGNAIGIGTATATTDISTASLANIAAGWGLVAIGTTANNGALTINANTWNTPTAFRTGSGAITIAGDQTMGVHNLTIETAGAVAINGLLSGSENLLIRGATNAISMVLGTTGGTINLDATEIGRISNGWRQLQFGRTDSTQTLTIGALNWNDAVHFMTGSGVMTVSGNQTFNANDATFETSGNIAINSTLTGTGILTLRQAAANIAMGLAGGAGVIIDATELGRINAGFSQLVFGRSDGTVAFTAATRSWNNPVTMQNGSGGITFTGAQTMNTHTLLARTYNGGNLTLNAGATISSTAAGNAVTLVANGNLVNNAGASALSVTGGGHWLTYSSTLAGSVTGGQVGDFRRFSCAFGGACPTLGTGNGQMYGNTPLLTITPNHTITYGDAFSTYSYTVANYLSAADQTGDVLTGTLTGTSPYVQGADAGSYSITYASGVLTSDSGYGFIYANNATGLTVAKKALTATINDPAAIAYGDTVPTLSALTNVSWAGFLSGQNAAVLDSVTFDYGTLTPATPAPAPGSYALSISAFSDNNYSLNIPVAVTDGVLTVTKRILTAQLVDAAPSRLVGAANPGFALQFTNFAAGDNASDIDTAPIASTVATLASVPGLYAILASGGTDTHYSFSFTNPLGMLLVRALPVVTPAATSATGVVLAQPAASVTNADPAAADVIPNTVKLVSQDADGTASAPEDDTIAISDDGNTDDGHAVLAGIIKIHPQLRALLNRSAAQEF